MQVPSVHKYFGGKHHVQVPTEDYLQYSYNEDMSLLNCQDNNNLR